MKKLFVLFISLVLLFSFTANAATDNTIYIPKVINTEDGNKLVYIPELAEIARRMSNDAYGIEKGATTSIAKTMKNEGFVDIQMRIDASKSLGDLPENFFVGVKNFKVNGKENHVLAIVFRGTDWKASLMDALIDVTADVLFVDLNGFHSGFYGSASNAFNILYNEISFSSLKNVDGGAMSFRDYINCCKDGKEGYYLLVTGHSLGGAIANVFVGDILAGFGVKNNAMCYTFGTPTVCSASKAKSLRAYNIFNIINTKDPVPQIGYNVSNGARLGKDLKQVVSAGSLLDNHGIGSAYKTTTALVRNNIDSMYKYTLSFYDQWCKEKQKDKTTDSIDGKMLIEAPTTGNNGNTNTSLGNSIVGVVDIPSSWDNLSIRTGPSTNYQIIGSMNDGVRCNVYPSKTQNGWYYVEYNGIYGYASGKQINTSNSSAGTATTTPAGISLSTSNVNLDYPSTASQTITVTATGTLPDKYTLELNLGGNINFNWGTAWSGNSINLTLNANQNSNSTTGTIYLKDSSSNNILTSINFNVNVTKPTPEPVVKETVLLHFNPNGGLAAPSSQIVEKYAVAEIPQQTPYRAGYKFVGWGREKDSTYSQHSVILPGGLFKMEDVDNTLYAMWEKEINKNEWDLSVSDDELFFEENYGTEKFADRNPTGISVYLNGRKLIFDVQPQIINSRTMVPMRKIFEELGTVVGWNNNTRKAVSVKKSDVVSVSIGGQYLTVNGEQKLLDSPPVIISGRTLVPVRAIAESYNCDVEWYDYGASKVVDINMNDTINRMENIGGLLIGYSEYPPFSFYDDNGNLIGFDTELAKCVCDFWGWDCSFVEIPFDMKFNAINSGEIDCYWNGITKTEEREELCTFSNDYVEYTYQTEEDGEWQTWHDVYSVPFRKGDYDTVQLVNIALEEAEKDGTIAYLKSKYGIE